MTTLILHMVCPGCRALGAHFKDVEHHGVFSGVGVAPDVVEYAKHADVQTPSTGSSPRRKCVAGIGEDLLSLRNSLNIFLSNLLVNP